MSLSTEDIARIAILARLAPNADEAERLRGQINGFFNIVEQMRSVNTEGIQPLTHPVSTMQMALRLRDDVASEPSGVAARDHNQRSAPAVERGLFLVPKVIE